MFLRVTFSVLLIFVYAYDGFDCVGGDGAG